MKPKVLVSACLLGQPVRYDGQSRPCAAVRALEGRYQLVPVCPELLGGLPVPRSASELDTSASTLRVVSAEGQDRTEAFAAGARRCVQVAREQGCRLAIMKAKSPSCGSRLVYDGGFTGTLVAGDGAAVRMLREAGVQVLSELDVEQGALGPLERGR